MVITFAPNFFELFFELFDLPINYVLFEFMKKINIYEKQHKYIFLILNGHLSQNESNTKKIQICVVKV
jgi:hypothetical protein